jgi:hypothetical protein
MLHWMFVLERRFLHKAKTPCTNLVAKEIIMDDTIDPCCRWQKRAIGAESTARAIHVAEWPDQLKIGSSQYNRLKGYVK